MRDLTSFWRSALVGLIIAGAGAPVYADTLVYQNTSTVVTAYVFNGAAMVGSDLAANVDINRLGLSAGSGGMSITSLSFQELNANSVSVSARPIMYVWADNGTGGLPGTLLDTLFLPLQSFAGSTTQTITDSLAFGSLIVPSDVVLYAGIGFDNANGMSTITSAQLNNLGGYTYYPASVGTAGTQAYFVAPGGATSNPSVIAFGAPNGADYGWTVTAAAATPEPSSILLLGSGLLGLSGMHASKARRRARA